MGKDDLLTELEVSEILKVTKGTLQKNRYIGKNHPPFKKIPGIGIRYLKSDLEKWVHKIQNVAELKEIA